MADKISALTADSSLGAWLRHPQGGEALRGLLAQAGMDAFALDTLRGLSLRRVMSLAGGAVPPGFLDSLVAQVNGGRIPAPEEAAEPEWKERITPGRFEGKTIIVTGAGSGIGRATAARLAREGGRVIAADIVPDRLADFAAELAGKDVITVTADVARPEDIERIVAAAGEHIDGLANIAGIMDDFSPLHEVKDELWERVFAVNVNGLFRLTRAVVPKMLSARRGSIVNIASVAGLHGSFAGLAYTASKHAVIGITRSTAFMYEPYGIRVNAVAPGGVLTNIMSPGAPTSAFGQDRILSIGKVVPMTIPEALAASITFLLSDDGVNVSGAVLSSDGGLSAY
jgi:NAD(P)-dependent dehydrogenase (short-subunit alcohol dehydrogenase family)